MKFRIFLCYLLILPGLSCSDTPPKTNLTQSKIEDKDSAKNKPPGSFSDTIIIHPLSAVFYTPDSLQLEKIKAISDTMIFESTIHDCFYQMRNSRMLLKQYYPRIKIIDVKNARYLLFVKTDGQNECIDLNTKNDPCGILIFDGHKKARLVDMTNIESELGLYFSG